MRLGLLGASTVVILVLMAAISPSWNDEFIVPALATAVTITLVIVRVALI